MHFILSQHNCFVITFFQVHEYLSLAGWDADFATTAYRQHVETLAQRQVWPDNFTFIIFYVSAIMFLIFFLLLLVVDGRTRMRRSNGK